MRIVRKYLHKVLESTLPTESPHKKRKNNNNNNKLLQQNQLILESVQQFSLGKKSKYTNWETREDLLIKLKVFFLETCNLQIALRCQTREQLLIQLLFTKRWNLVELLHYFTLAHWKDWKLKRNICEKVSDTSLKSFHRVNCFLLLSLVFTINNY